MATESDWERLIGGLERGDDEIVTEFCGRYGRPLTRLAEQNIAPALRRRMGPESVVQSACCSFLRRAKDGQFELKDAAELWRLLCAMTLRKLRGQARRHLSGKRGIQHEVSPDEDDAGVPTGVASEQPSPAEAAAVAEQFQLLIEGLEEEERQVVELKLQEYTNPEIAARMNCSQRTVRRLFGRIRDRLAISLDEG